MGGCLPDFGGFLPPWHQSFPRLHSFASLSHPLDHSFVERIMKSCAKSWPVGKVGCFASMVCSGSSSASSPSQEPHQPARSSAPQAFRSRLSRHPWAYHREGPAASVRYRQGSRRLPPPRSHRLGPWRERFSNRAHLFLQSPVATHAVLGQIGKNVVLQEGGGLGGCGLEQKQDDARQEVKSCRKERRGKMVGAKIRPKPTSTRELLEIVLAVD